MPSRKCICCNVAYGVSTEDRYKTGYCEPCKLVRGRDPDLFDWFLKVMEGRVDRQIESAIDKHESDNSHERSENYYNY